MTYIQHATSIQATYSPIDYTFFWVGDWYEFDSVTGKKLAIKARNAEVKRLRSQGWTVKPWTAAGQLVSKGGIGSGHPHIEEIVSVYGFDAYKQGG